MLGRDTNSMLLLDKDGLFITMNLLGLMKWPE